MFDKKLKTRLLEQSLNSIKMEILFSIESELFEGHFPDFPIVAGVLQIHLAISLYEKNQNQKISFGGFKSVKFFRPIYPGTLTHLNCLLEQEKGEFSFKYTNGEVVYSKGVMRLKSE